MGDHSNLNDHNITILPFSFRAYQWIMKHNGIPTEDSYGNYLGIDGFCHVDDPTTVMGLQVCKNCRFSS